MNKDITDASATRGPTAAPERSLLVAMAQRYNISTKGFEETIKATVMPSGATNEQLAAFLLVAQEHDLNPITKEIHAFPTKGGGIQPVVGIDGWIKMASRRREFDGMEFDFDHDKTGNVISCTCIIWRKDRSRPIAVTEFISECKRNTDPWNNCPRRMIRHKATIQAIRYAFGFAGIMDEDDAARITERNITPSPSVSTEELNNQLAITAESAIEANIQE